MTATLPTRTGDPSTSFAAAETAAMNAGRIRPVVLEIVREAGPLTHDELIGEYHKRLVLDDATPTASDSGIRTRLRELRYQGLVVESEEKGASLYGNPAKQWVAVDAPDFVDPGLSAGSAGDTDSDVVVDVDDQDALA